ncbi:hypothetical protein bcere0022_19960 [Bacillus cereus Rock3-44]|nr:hypothetical protein bcere0022_19960 [Bacillus cereus Rock3-44]
MGSLKKTFHMAYYDASGNNTPWMNSTVVYLVAFVAFATLVEQLELYFVLRYT